MAIDNAVDRQNVVDDAGYLHYLPDHLQQRYREGLQDAQLTHLRRQIALADVRVKMLLETLDRKVLTSDRLAADIRESFSELDEMLTERLGEFFESYLPDGYIDNRTFKSLERLTEKYDDAMTSKNLIKADQALRQLFDAIRRGRRDGEIWHEIDEVMDSRRKLVEAEERRLHHTQQTLSTDTAVRILHLTISTFREAVVRYVLDHEVQSLVLREAERIYAEQLAGKSDLAANTISLE